MGCDRVEVYLARDGWRWRYVRNNGRVMADSGEAYVRRSAALHGAGIVTRASPDRRDWVEVAPDVWHHLL